MKEENKYITKKELKDMLSEFVNDIKLFVRAEITTGNTNLRCELQTEFRKEFDYVKNTLNYIYDEFQTFREETRFELAVIKDQVYEINSMKRELDNHEVRISKIEKQVNN